MEAFFVSIGTIALAELGDKTMILTLALAARYRAPLQIVLGIIIATLANHALAGALGAWLQSIAGGSDILRYVVGGVFIALGIWMLIPDRPKARPMGEDLGPLIATIISFFIAELGDKSQIATLALASHAPSLLLVIIGTTLGVVIVNVPVVFVGNFVSDYLPIGLIRGLAVAVFVIIGVLILIGIDFGMAPGAGPPPIEAGPEPENF
jgi:putative Ca2+/H+ antiporter (TMEM165/GDT1 family)